MRLDRQLRSELKRRLAAGGRRRRGTITAFVLGTTRNIHNRAFFLSAVRETRLAATTVIAQNLMIRELAALPEILRLVDGRVDYVMVDVEVKARGCARLLPRVAAGLNRSRLALFRGNAVTAAAGEHFLAAHFLAAGGALDGKRALIAGSGHLGGLLAQALVEHGVRVAVHRRNRAAADRQVAALNALRAPHGHGRAERFRPLQPGRFDILVGAANGRQVIDAALVRRVRPGGIILDAGIRTLTPAAIDAARQRNLPAVCLLAKPGFDGMVLTWLAARAAAAAAGTRPMPGGYALVSGGVIGARGDVIVDDCRRPTRVLGICRGDGLVLNYDEKAAYAERLRRMAGRLRR